MTWQGMGARDGETGVAQRGAGCTRRARVSSEDRDKRITKKRKTTHQSRTNRGDGGAREEGEAGGQQRHKGTLRLAQRNAMPMTRIEPYRPPRPTIRELMEGRGGGGRRGSPPEGVSGEAARVGLQVRGQGEALRRVRAHEIQPSCIGRPAESTRNRRTTVRGRTRDRREGREKRGERRETRGGGAHLAWPGTAKGHAPRGRWDRRRAPREAVTR